MTHNEKIEAATKLKEIYDTNTDIFEDPDTTSISSIGEVLVENEWEEEPFELSRYLYR